MFDLERLIPSIRRTIRRGRGGSLRAKWIWPTRIDRWAITVLLLGAATIGARLWLAEHPQHNPWAPLDLRDPPGWATQRKIAALRGDTEACRAVLERSQVAFAQLEPVGQPGTCRRDDRTILTDYPFQPSRPQMTCAVAAAQELWLRQSLEPAAEEILGSGIAAIRHLGTFNCRRMYGSDDGPWSEHATGNAIDIAGFVLDDGQAISVLADWEGEDEAAQFLRRARDSACDVFGSVLSPDYNAAHRDHFHLDQKDRVFGSACR